MPEHSPDYSSLGQQAIEMRLKHYDAAYKLSSRITNAISRCQLDEQYWFSTKQDSNVAVLHTEDCFYEGPIGYVAELLDGLETADEFIEAVGNGMVRGVYPWMELIKGGEAE